MYFSDFKLDTLLLIQIAKVSFGSSSNFATKDLEVAIRLARDRA
jgi:hypothetical protein